MTSETKVSAMDTYSTTGDSMVPRSTIQQLMYALCVAFGGQSNQKTSVVIIIFKSSKGQLLEKAEHDLAETKRDLEVYKKAFCIAERDKHDLEERFEREKQSLNDEICQLRENEARVREERFEQEKQALNEGIFQLKAILTHERRVRQQNPPPVPADMRQHAMGRKGTQNG